MIVFFCSYSDCAIKVFFLLFIASLTGCGQAPGRQSGDGNADRSIVTVDEKVDHLRAEEQKPGKKQAKKEQAPMTDENARKAIVRMLEESKMFPPQTKEYVQEAKAVREKDFVDIGNFRCYLEKKTFTYGPHLISANILGFFYQDENGEWDAKITQSAKATLRPKWMPK